MSQEDLELMEIFHNKGQTTESLKTVYYLVDVKTVNDLERYAKIGRLVMRIKPFAIGVAVIAAVALFVAGILPLSIPVYIALAAFLVLALQNDSRWW